MWLSATTRSGCGLQQPGALCDDEVWLWTAAASSGALCNDEVCSSLVHSAMTRSGCGLQQPPLAHCDDEVCSSLVHSAMTRSGCGLQQPGALCDDKVWLWTAAAFACATSSCSLPRFPDDIATPHSHGRTIVCPFSAVSPHTYHA